MPTTIAPITTEAGLRINRRLRRCVDPGRPGHRNDCSLFTFNRVSDETYTFVRADVSAAAADAWLRGEDPAACQAQQARSRQCRLAADIEAVAVQAHADGRTAAAAFIRAAWANQPPI